MMRKLLLQILITGCLGLGSPVQAEQVLSCEEAFAFSQQAKTDLSQLKRWLQRQKVLVSQFRASLKNLNSKEGLQSFKEEFDQLQGSIYGKLQTASFQFKSQPEKRYFLREGVVLVIPKDNSGGGQIFDERFSIESLAQMGDIFGRAFDIFQTDSLSPPLNINFYPLNVRGTDDRVSSADSENSALAVAFAVNLLSGQTDVLAEVLPTRLALKFHSMGLKELYRFENDLELNAVKVSADISSAADFVSVINESENFTGLQARLISNDPNKQEVELLAKDGRNIEWKFHSDRARDFTSLVFGDLALGWENRSRIFYGSVKLSSSVGPFYLEDPSGLFGSETAGLSVDQVISRFHELSLTDEVSAGLALESIKAAEAKVSKGNFVIDEVLKLCKSPKSIR